MRSSNLAAASSIASFLIVTRAGGEPRVFPLLQMRSVSASAKLSITVHVVTYVVNNVKRYYKGYRMPSRRFSAEGKNTPAGETVHQRMLQALLSNSFKLAVHRETRLIPVYELVIAGDGPKLRESDSMPRRFRSSRDSS